jgi:hypothetical protein
VVRFLRLKGTSQAEIHRQLVEVAIRRKWPGLVRRGVVLMQDNARPHKANRTALQLRNTGPSFLRPWHRTEWFSSLWTIEEAPGWKVIRNRRWSSASRHVLASGAWHWFLLCWDRCLGVPVGQMIRQVWGLCRKIICTKAVLLIIRVYIIWINLRNERTCYLTYWTAHVLCSCISQLRQHEDRRRKGHQLINSDFVCLKSSRTHQNTDRRKH